MNGKITTLEPLRKSHLGTFIHRITIEDVEESYALHSNWFVSNTLKVGDVVEYEPSLNSVPDDYGNPVYWLNRIRVITEVGQDEESQVEVTPDL